MGATPPQNEKKKGEAPERTSPKYSRVTNGQHHHTEYCHTGALINRCTNLQANHKKNHTNQLHPRSYEPRVHAHIILPSNLTVNVSSTCIVDVRTTLKRYASSGSLGDDNLFTVKLPVKPPNLNILSVKL